MLHKIKVKNKTPFLTSSGFYFKENGIIFNFQ